MGLASVPNQMYPTLSYPSLPRQTLPSLPYSGVPYLLNPTLSYPTYPTLPDIPYRGLPYLPYRIYTPLLYPTLRCPSLFFYILPYLPSPAQPYPNLNFHTPRTLTYLAWTNAGRRGPRASRILDVAEMNR